MYVCKLCTYIHEISKKENILFYFILFYGFLREQQKIDSLVVISFFFFGFSHIKVIRM